MYTTPYHSEELSKFSFLVTGGAGFIGANLVEYLLTFGARKVRVLDNLATGFKENLSEFIAHPAFEFMEGDIRNLETCKKAMQDMDYVSHQAALGSVPRSIHDPITSNEVNVSGFLNMLVAQKENALVIPRYSLKYDFNSPYVEVYDGVGFQKKPVTIGLLNELEVEILSGISPQDVILVK